MKKDQADGCCQEQPHNTYDLFGCDPGPIAVLAVFVLLFMQFFPEMRRWVLVLIASGVLLRLVVAYFRNRS